MHTTTTSATRTPRRLVFLTLLAALLLLALAQAVPVFAASGDYSTAARIAGGHARRCVANDHTVYALRFIAATARLCDTATPADAAPVLRQDAPHAQRRRLAGRHRQPRLHLERHVAARGSRSARTGRSFPIVTTDGRRRHQRTGSPWFYFKFGDTTKTRARTTCWSRSSAGGGAAPRRTAPPPSRVTVLDPTHDRRRGSTTASTTGDRRQARRGRRPRDARADPSGACSAPSRTSCDDDADGIVDDEQYGPVADAAASAWPCRSARRSTRRCRTRIWPAGVDRLHRSPSPTSTSRSVRPTRRRRARPARSRAARRRRDGRRSRGRPRPTTRASPATTCTAGPTRPRAPATRRCRSQVATVTTRHDLRPTPA